MIKIINVSFCVIVLFSNCKTVPNPSDSNILPSNVTSKDINSFKLVWSDEFDTDGAPDSTKWQYETGFVRNEENQWYQKENAVCSNGNLIISGKKERRNNPNFISGSTDWKINRAFIDYTSASVVMKKEHAFKYGRMEVRAKIVAQTGLWPAIWTLGTSGEWPSNGEVDVMEYYDNKILANFAYANVKRYQAIWDGASKPMSAFDPNWANSYHIWTLDWTENRMEILLDGLSMNTIDLNTTINKSNGKNPFQQAHYILLNLALGGKNGGSLANTIFPSQYLIDYVRVYAPN